MRDPEEINLTYHGYRNPESPDELDFELLGLECLIATAQKRIFELKQGKLLAKKVIERLVNENNNSKK